MTTLKSVEKLRSYDLGEEVYYWSIDEGGGVYLAKALLKSFDNKIQIAMVVNDDHANENNYWHFDGMNILYDSLFLGKDNSWIFEELL